MTKVPIPKFYLIGKKKRPEESIGVEIIFPILVLNFKNTATTSIEMKNIAHTFGGNIFKRLSAGM